MKKKEVNNYFLDLLSYIISFFFSIFRSIKLLITHNNKQKKGKFFRFFDFIFIDWPKNYWKKPTGLKIGNFIGDLIGHLFDIDKKGK